MKLRNTFITTLFLSSLLFIQADAVHIENNNQKLVVDKIIVKDDSCKFALSYNYSSDNYISIDLTRTEFLKLINDDNKEYNYYLGDILLSKDEILKFDLKNYIYNLDVTEDTIVVRQSDYPFSLKDFGLAVLYVLGILFYLLLIACLFPS